MKYLRKRTHISLSDLRESEIFSFRSTNESVSNSAKKVATRKNKKEHDKVALIELPIPRREYVIGCTQQVMKLAKRIVYRNNLEHPTPVQPKQR